MLIKKQRVFDFKKQCFYCGKICLFDSKHLDRNPYKTVAIKDANFYNVTVELCKSRTDDYSKTIERRLLRYFFYHIISKSKGHKVHALITATQKIRIWIFYFFGWILSNWCSVFLQSPFNSLKVLLLQKLRLKSNIFLMLDFFICRNSSQTVSFEWI